jgi:molybdenum cofactor cytidylyltransferase
MTTQRPAAVVLAAGASRRMGKDKALLRLGRDTFLEVILSTLRSAAVAEVALVVRDSLRPAVESLLEIAARSPDRGRPGLLVNPSPDSGGMLSSIRIGLASVSRSVPFILIWPVDHPLVAPETVRRMIAFGEPGRVVLPTYQGHRGHPAALGAEFRGAVEDLSGEQGLRALWRRIPERVMELPVEDPGVLANLDRPEDYERARRRWTPGALHRS